MPQNCKASCKKNQGAAGLRLLPEKDLGDMKLTACHANGLRETRQGSKPLAISLGLYVLINGFFIVYLCYNRNSVNRMSSQSLAHSAVWETGVAYTPVMRE